MKVKKLVFGVGINDADYAVHKWKMIEVNGKRKQKLVWICPFYRTWKGMLERCYSAKYQERYPTYKGCSVSEEWLLFSSFSTWMVTQDWEGKQLDKDLLVEGNKDYSKDTCVFVTGMVNNFITDRGNDRGEWLIGVCWNKSANKFRSRCNNPFTKKCEHLGYFDCEQEAHQEWLKRKLELAKELAAIQTDERVAKALTKRYTNHKSNIAAKQHVENTNNGGSNMKRDDIHLNNASILPPVDTPLLIEYNGEIVRAYRKDYIKRKNDALTYILNSTNPTTEGRGATIEGRFKWVYA